MSDKDNVEREELEQAIDAQHVEKISKIPADGMTDEEREYAEQYPELSDDLEDLDYDLEDLEEIDLEDPEDPEGPEDLDPEDPDPEVNVTETITIVKQPVITSVQVSAELDQKGVIRPACRGSIERHIDPDEIDVDVFEVIAEDFDQLAAEVAQRVLTLKDQLNE